MVDFVKISPLDLKDNWSCPVCLEERMDGVVAHNTGEGMKHPIHQACFDKALESSNTCPVCRTKLSERQIEQVDHSQVKITQQKRRSKPFLNSSFTIHNLFRPISFSSSFFIDPLFSFDSFFFPNFSDRSIMVYI